MENSPVTGIASAVSSIFGSLSNIHRANKEENIAYQQWLNTATPGLIDYYDFEKPPDNSRLIIISLSVILGLLIVAFIFLRGKK